MIWCPNPWKFPRVQRSRLLLMHILLFVQLSLKLEIASSKQHDKCPWSLSHPLRQLSDAARFALCVFFGIMPCHSYPQCTCDCLCFTSCKASVHLLLSKYETLLIRAPALLCCSSKQACFDPCLASQKREIWGCLHIVQHLVCRVTTRLFPVNTAAAADAHSVKMH